jgi:hypothetical protein
VGWNAGMRFAAFSAAAAAWNQELMLLGSPVQIQVVSTAMQQPPAGGDFAADWAGVMCTDNTSDAVPRNAYYHDFLVPDGHHANGTSTGSFGHPVPMAAPPRPNGPGWTGNQKPLGSDVGMDILAETLTAPPPGGMGNLTEADIVFHTHFLENMNCSLIPWTVGAQVGFFDFQSVALHELGHALGLGHLGPDNNVPGNVMRPSIRDGQVLSINALERNALAALYGPGGACPPPPPPPPPAQKAE